MRLVLVLICCSTVEYCTSCCVNWFVSSGLVGSWFFNWAVSRVRNVLKLPDSVVLAVAAVEVTDWAAAVVGLTVMRGSGFKR